MKTRFLIAFLTAILTVPAFAQSTETSKFVQKRDDFKAMLDSGKEDWYNNPKEKEWFKNYQTNIFSVLDAIEIMPEWRLDIIDLPDTEGRGRLFDERYICVENVNSGKEFYDLYGYLNFLSYIRLKSISVESCWQLFLLYCMLPPYWRDYREEDSDLILTEEDRKQILKYIKVIPDSLIDNEEDVIGGLSETNYRLLKDYKIKPVRVDVNELKRTAEITLCTWNDWVGLTEKKFSITIKDDNTALVENIDYKIIVKYDSGIID